MKCAIIDDEQASVDVLKYYIEKIPELDLCGAFLNPIEGLKEIKQQQIKLVFLDIQMVEMSGIEVKNILENDVKVIFCTAFPEYAVEGFNLNAVDYLLKPASFERFQKAVGKVLNSSENHKNDDFVFIKTEQKGKLIKIFFDEVSHIESLGNYVNFFSGGQKLTAYTTLKDLESALPKNFIRIHKSFIVNTEKIILIENGFAVVKSIPQNYKIPIGESYKAIFMENLKRNML